MKLERLALWEEKYLFNEQGDREKGFVGWLKGTFFDEMLSLSEMDVSDDTDYMIRYEFESLCLFLQGEGAGYMLRTLSDLTAFCRDKMQDHIPYSFNRECWGFRVVTDGYIWYIGCTPWNDKRHFAIFCYDRNKLMGALAAEKELPLYCHGVLKFTGERVIIYYGMNDMETFPQYGGNIVENRTYANEQNEKLNLSIEQISAMENGAIYGWDTPVANPYNYDENGHFYVPEPEEKGRRR